MHLGPKMDSNPRYRCSRAKTGTARSLWSACACHKYKSGGVHGWSFSRYFRLWPHGRHGDAPLNSDSILRILNARSPGTAVSFVSRRQKARSSGDAACRAKLSELKHLSVPEMYCEISQTSVLFCISPSVKRHTFQLHTMLLLSCNLELTF
jgi:hypothetical protein